MNRVLRTLVPAAVGAALVASFSIGAAVGDDDPVPPTPPTSREPTGCEDLLGSYVDRAVDRVGPWGWGPVAPGGLEDIPLPRDSAGSTASDSQESAESAPAPTTTRQTNEASGTTVQEAGVDEPDVAKTDGEVLYRVEGDDLTTYDVGGADVVRLGSVDLDGVDRGDGVEILLAGSTVVAMPAATGGVRSETGVEEASVVVLDVSDPADPVVVHTLEHDAALATARLHGETLRLVLRRGLADLSFTTPDGDDDSGLLPDWFDDESDEATTANRDVVRDSELDDWLPHVTVDGGEESLLADCEDVAVPDDPDAPLGTVAVVGLDLADLDDLEVTALAVDATTVYTSTDRLYLATSAAWGGVPGCFDCRASVVGGPGDDGRSTLWSYDLDGTATVPVATGRVDGTIADRWSLDEQDGVLRVALGPSSSTEDGNTVATLEEDGDELVLLGRVDGIGWGEDLKAVRWFDDVAVLVTFRETDPLWAVDLADDEDPEIIGELEIPGFSSYLHPLGEQRMIGVGEGPGRGGWGAQTGLFDVHDLTDPTRLAVVHHGAGTVALAATDARALTWLPDLRTVLEVVADGSSGYVSVLRLGDGSLTEERVDLGAAGRDVEEVRTVPLPDGRVVLTTGDDASFLPLA